jgi:hypothetical protein
LPAVKSALSQVVVKVLPGNGNATNDNASGASTETLILLGSIAFSKS